MRRLAAAATAATTLLLAGCGDASVLAPVTTVAAPAATPGEARTAAAAQPEPSTTTTAAPAPASSGQAAAVTQTAGGRGQGTGGQGSGGGQGRDAGTAAAYTLTVRRGDAVLATYTPANLESLERISVVADGREQRGPRVRAVLAKAGITQFSSLTVRGAVRQRVAMAEVTLSAAQVTETLVLDASQRGTFKLAGPDLDPAQWIIDVTELVATP
ncbi:MAG: hypothetical protein FJ029_07720 [Actinobacteria bacterium]|nr:hypothetical protein [Actinomycetota bacterium]